MKIDIENGLVVDTDKLSDRDAAIHEAVKKFYDVCNQYGVTSMTRVCLSSDKFIGHQTYNSEKTKRIADFECLIDSINQFLSVSSEGQLAVMMKEEN